MLGDVVRVRRILADNPSLDIDDLDYMCGTEWTALSAAAAHSPHVEVIQVLLDFGANIEATNEEGCTALMQCAEHGRLEALQLLIDNQARLEATNVHGYTAWWVP